MSRRRASRLKVSPPKRGRVRAEDVPYGLTLERVQKAVGGPFDGLAPGTGAVYERHLSYFENWCGKLGVPLVKVSTYHLKVYAKEMHKDKGVSVSWLGCAVGAVKKVMTWEGWYDQVDWDDIAGQLRGYRRQDLYAAVGVDGITRELFEIIELYAWRVADGESAEKVARRAAFDLALISLMRDCLLRRSEAAAVRWGDITIERSERGTHGALKIPFSKTDRRGKGEVGFVSIETLALLQDYAVLCGRDPHRLNDTIFGIGEKQVANRIKAACDRAGLGGRFSGHSCRVGMAIDLAVHNVSLAAIMQAGRWRVPATVIRYIRTIAIANSPVATMHKIWDGEREAHPYEAAA